MTGAELITAVLDEGGFDVSRTVVLRWLNHWYVRLVRISEWIKADASFGNTVSGTAEYALPAGTLKLLTLKVDGEPYIRVGKTRLDALKFAEYSVDKVWAPDHTSGGVEQVELYPTPDETGLAIRGLVVQSPTALADGAVAPVTPDESHNWLVDAAIGTGLGRLDGRKDEAAQAEAVFDAHALELRGWETSRQGSGAVRLKVNRYY